MRIFLYQALLCLTALLIKTPIAAAQVSTVQVILAAEMPDIADPQQGRYAELKQLIYDERKRVPTTFFLFGGGSIGPSALSNLDRGSHIIDILNSLEPDAMGAAKREFSFTVDELSLRSYEAAFPIVASNLIDKRLNAVPDGLSDRALITRNI
jgi:5'-nucleotidase/UDP-sugar diphosphatase